MKIGKSIDIYEKMLKNALDTTSHHKIWWFLGALAGLAATGDVFNNVFKTFIKLQPADKITIDTLENIFPALPWLTVYTQNIIANHEQTLQLSIIFSIFALVIITIIILSAQYLLINTAITRTKKRPIEQIQKLLHNINHLHILRLFTINILSWIILTILLSVSALILAILLTYSFVLNIFIYAGVYAIILPIIFIINIISIIMIIHVIQHEDSLGIALREALLLLKKHWVTAMEYSLIIFTINFASSIALIILLILITLITSILFTIMAAMNSFIMMSFITFSGILISTIIIILFAGAITMFNYSAWVELAHRLKRYGHIPVIEHSLNTVSQIFNK